MTDIFNTIPEKVERYFYVFADLDSLSANSCSVPVYELKVKLDYSMLDIIEDCFNNCVTMLHVADMYVSTEIHNKIFTYLSASVNEKNLNLVSINMFLKQNGEIQIPYDVRRTTRRITS